MLSAAVAVAACSQSSAGVAADGGTDSGDPTSEDAGSVNGCSSLYDEHFDGASVPTGSGITVDTTPPEAKNTVSIDSPGRSGMGSALRTTVTRTNDPTGDSAGLRLAIALTPAQKTLRLTYAVHLDPAALSGARVEGGCALAVTSTEDFALVSEQGQLSASFGASDSRVLLGAGAFVAGWYDVQVIASFDTQPFVRVSVTPPNGTPVATTIMIKGPGASFALSCGISRATMSAEAGTSAAASVRVDDVQLVVCN